MAYIAIIQKKANVDGWDLGTVRYYIYDGNLTCDQGKALFVALDSMAKKLAATTLLEPAAESGYQKQLRNCQAPVTDDGYFDVDTSYFEGGTSTGGGGGGSIPVSDAAAETNVINYTSASGDDGGTK